MGAPHNKERYGQTWSEIHTAVMGLELDSLVEGSFGNVIISGGWAWCLMSPSHTEYKHAHDLKDFDFFVKPEYLGEFVEWLKLLDYTREHTKYDHLSPFYRYTKMIQGRGCGEEGATTIEKQAIIDLFVNDVPSMQVRGYTVVRPDYLASLYGKHDPDSRLHGSGQCWSLHNALSIMGPQNDWKKLIDNPQLSDFSTWVK